MYNNISREQANMRKVDIRESLDRGRSIRESNIAKTMSNCDKAFLQGVLKRQYYVLSDLYKIHDLYPDLIDADIVGSLDTLFRAMHDMAQSAIGITKSMINVK